MAKKLSPGAAAKRGAAPASKAKPSRKKATGAKASGLKASGSKASGKGVKSAKRAAKPGKAGARAAVAVAVGVRPVQPLVPLAGPAPPPGSRAQVLDRLWSVVLARREADPAVSHSARLLSRGSAKVAQKFGEEAVECLIEAVAGNRAALVAESADVLYHLLVLWVDGDVRPDEVWAELERREGVSGIAEKAARLPSLTGLGTSKIP